MDSVGIWIAILLVGVIILAVLVDVFFFQIPKRRKRCMDAEYARGDNEGYERGYTAGKIFGDKEGFLRGQANPKRDHGKFVSVKKFAVSPDDVKHLDHKEFKDDEIVGSSAEPTKETLS